MITKRPWIAFAFLAPAIVLYSIFTLYPLLSGIWLSFTDSEGGPVANFTGIENYVRLLQDENFWSAIQFTLTYAVIVVVVQNAIGIWVARSLFLRPKIRKLGGVLVLLPVLVSPLMASFIFSYVLAPQGALNQLLEGVGLEALTRVWLGDPTTALPSVAMVNIWTFAGYSATIFLAGYLALPAELLDAASVDGASGWRQFRAIEWPLLAPALTVNITLSLIGALRVFEYPFVLTGGGPAGATTSLSLLIYNKTFLAPGNFSFGIALAVMLLVLVVTLSGIATTLLRSRENRI